MTALRLSDIARVVSLRGNTTIDDEPIMADDGKWALYRGGNVVRRSRYRTYILYLYSDCKEEHVLAAAHALPEPAITEVIYPRTLEDRLIRGNEEMRGRCATRNTATPRGSISSVASRNP